MSAENAPTDPQRTPADSAPRIPQWRKVLGIGLFVLHLILPVLALIFVPLFGFPESVNVILLGLSVVGGPDLILVVSIAMLGKDGVTELMMKFGSVVKRLTKWDAVTKTRYTVGLWVGAIALVVPTLILFFWHDSIADISGAPGWGFWVLLISTFAFIGAVISMGQPLWSRIEAIVTWDAQIILPEDAT
ncbi:MAG: hypothetical protein ACR2N2_01075 [Acidimicrobiia bacterium]